MTRPPARASAAAQTAQAWSRYRPIDGVGTMGRQAGDATVLRAASCGSDMEVRD
jgi:hypothetical protein